MTQPLVQATGISKSFRGIAALKSVGISVGAGEVHALLGENGAGKSTLLKIMSGAQSPDTGEILLAGEAVDIDTPQKAQRLGIATIYQELTLVPALSIAENIFIGREPGVAGLINWRAMSAQARALMARVGLDKNPTMPASELSVAEQQLVEIARALSMKSRLIIMDEPTAALSSSEVEKLFDIVRSLRVDGISVIFVTHRLEEVMRICDRYTVFRDGTFVGSGDVASTSVDALIQMMVGREVVNNQRRATPDKLGPVVLSVEALSRGRNALAQSAMALSDLSLDVRSGEILGIAGLVGSGRTEMARAIFGADRFEQGVIRIDGNPLRLRSPRDAIRQGIGLVPEDRKQQALFLALSIRENLSITTQHRISRFGAFIDRKAEAEMVDEYRRMLRIRMVGPEQIIADLSGGNQQKVILARWLALRPKVLIVDEPTRGIDIGAKAEVHNLLFQMAEAGIAVIAISSELPEVLGLSDRIITMREGRITGNVPGNAATPEGLMAMMAVSTAAQ